MGMMIGSGECWKGECEHPEHLSKLEKITKLRELVEEAIKADPSRFVMGQSWHDRAKKFLELI